MKTIPWSDSTDVRELGRTVAETLAAGGLACVPCGGKYRLVADLTNADAVMHLMQSKGRMRRGPALVFVGSVERLGEVAEEIDPLGLRLAQALWPRPLTLRFRPSSELPAKVLKQLGGSRATIGVRVPDEPLLREVLAALGRPVLVSSANKERRAGEGSPAQVRKSFGATVELLVDRGDLAPAPPSTIVQIRDGRAVVERPGAVAPETIAGLCEP